MRVHGCLRLRQGADDCGRCRHGCRRRYQQTSRRAGGESNQGWTLFSLARPAVLVSTRSSPRPRPPSCTFACSAPRWGPTRCSSATDWEPSPTARHEYEQAKEQAAATHAGDADFDDYTRAKGAFFDQVQARLPADRRPPRRGWQYLGLLTSSISECWRSGAGSILAAVTWAYFRSALLGYLAASCIYTCGPRRYRAVVGPSLGPFAF